MKKKLAKRVISIVQYNSRSVAIKLDTNPVNTFIIQVFVPTSYHGDVESKEIYEQIDEDIKLSRRNDNLVISEDWNAVVGKTKKQGVTITFGLRRKNHRGERLIEFCKEQNLIITNTLFLQPKRKRYTWTMP